MGLDNHPDETYREGGKVPKNKLLERIQKFASSQWMDFLRLSLEVSEAASQLRSRRRRNPTGHSHQTT